jgi:hypothetical protein
MPGAAVAFVATFALVFVSIVRPMEIWPSLEALRLLDVLTALAALGVAIDFALGRQKNFYSLQLPFLLGFLLLSYGVSAVRLGGDGIDLATTRSLITSVFMLVVMYGARTLGRLRAIVTLLVVSCIFVAGVAVHQGLQEPQCIELMENGPDVIEILGGRPDGRSCATRMGCYEEGLPNTEYACERVGLFSTGSDYRRVRWRGQLADPNELSVFIGAVIPLTLTMAAATRKRYVIGLALAVIGLELYAVILTQSRGGQLVIATVFAAFFVGRYRTKGLLGLLLAVPVLLFGGREGLAAESSSEARTDLLYEGINIFARYPVFGVGINGFAEELGHTAHNAYLLAATELGMTGMLVWTGLLWASLKIPVTIVRNPPARLDPGIRTLAIGLIVSLLGMAVGIFFLSFTYKQLLFVWLGMCGALYGVVQNSDPAFRVRMGLKDCVGIVGFDVLLLTAIYAYTRLKA